MTESESNGRRILVVDDEEGIRASLAAFLRQGGYPHTDEACGGGEALELLERQPYFLVITDISMPDMSGLDLLAHVRRERPDCDVAVITGHMELEFAIQAIRNGAFDFFKKPFRFEEVLHTIHRVAEKQYLQRRSLELERLRERRRAEDRHVKEFMLTLARIIDMKSPYTREHSDRTSRIATLIAESVGLGGDEVERVALGARLHDIGKLATPDRILDKPGPLTPDEYAVMKEHPQRGADLCACIACLAPVVPMVRWHHENLDGSGYPDGLKGDAIPLDARIVRISDYWDAITSHRSYRAPMKVEVATKVIEEECACGRLDGELAAMLFDHVRSGRLARVKAAPVPGAP